MRIYAFCYVITLAALAGSVYMNHKMTVQAEKFVGIEHALAVRCYDMGFVNGHASVVLSAVGQMKTLFNAPEECQ